MSEPVVSVVMPFFNAAEFIGQAVRSVLDQTFTGFELIAVDDASTDASRRTLEEFADPRIIILGNRGRLGVAASLNRGLDAARGKYIARMDADDVCMPARFASQVRFLDQNPAICVCGTWVRRFGGGRSYTLRFPVGRECVRSYVLLGNPLAHPSVMFRRDELLAKDLRYDESCSAGQDYDLWVRASVSVGMDNIPEVLIKWRHNSSGVTSGSFSASDKTARELQRSQLWKLGIDVTSEEMDWHRVVGNGGGVSGREGLRKAAAWLDKLLAANEAAGMYPKKGLEQACAFAWFRCCLNSSCLGAAALDCLKEFGPASNYKPTWDEWARFVMRHFVLHAKSPQGRPADLAACNNEN